MARFCTRCGRPLEDGQVCVCSGGARAPEVGRAPAYTQQKAQAKGFFETMKNQMGIGNPELNQGDVYEKGKRIIPDCVRPNEGEVPVKQYEVAKLQSRVLGIPYAKAIGRMQVTNKRVIFRAPGKSIGGRTTLQHEFAIDELAGVEARREYRFNPGDVFLGIFTFLFAAFLTTWLVTKMCGTEIAMYIVLPLLFGIGLAVPFFLVKKLWLLKVLCLGGASGPLYSFGVALGEIEKYEFFGDLMWFLSIITFLCALVALFFYAIRPNMVLVVKTKAATDAIDVRSRSLIGGINGSEHTGYNEVLPAEDTERCIREVNALINDIQKLGDFGIEKWAR